MTVKPLTKVTMAIPKRSPWSPWMEKPSHVRWLKMAADIALVVRIPPAHLIRGQSSPIEASNSQIPCPQRHQGSVPILLKMYFDSGAPESKYIFSKMGTEPWWRWGQGIWELLASIGLLWPRIRWAGGILTTSAMSAAILSHLTWLGFSIQGDHGLLFGMAIVTFVSGFTVMMLHRHSIPNYVSLSHW